MKAIPSVQNSPRKLRDPAVQTEQREVSRTVFSAEVEKNSSVKASFSLLRFLLHPTSGARGMQSKRNEEKDEQRISLGRLSNCLLILIFLGLGMTACEDIVEVPDISNAQVTILAPLNNTVVTDSIVNFTWEEVMDANDYQLQVAIPDFENTAQILLDSIIVVDSTFAGPRGILQMPNGDYEWRVRARNSAYNTAYTRSAFTVNAGN